jgi:hypothetical protein
MTTKKKPINPGPIALFGSGETAPSGQKIFDTLFQLTDPSPKVKILETPAGFELNSDQVASSVGSFIKHHLQNYHPEIEIIPARKKDTSYSPDNQEIAQPILDADLVFMGPGSPTYAVRQLNNSLSWEYILARHRLGAGLAFSSAATVAISSFALPVYEIYKVGEDLHWKSGLDFFSHYGLPFVFIPHWNNQDGGEGLDTSRCYMGVSRFEELVEILPTDQIIIGIDENTGLVIDLQASCLHGVGQGNVTIINKRSREVIPANTAVNLTELGDFELCDPLAGISPESWQTAVLAEENRSYQDTPPEELIILAASRWQAKEEKNWEEADRIRIQIEAQGWSVQDSSNGYKLERKTDL